MSYHIYTTDGIILRRVGFGEANILLHVLTEDLGLVIASARSARLAVSKLRPALQEYAHVSISCIKGKNGWKITNVVEKNNFYFDLPEQSRKSLAQIGSVLMQMIPGESPHPEIFQTAQSGFEFLKSISAGVFPKSTKGGSGEHLHGTNVLASFETLIVLRILYQLGYVVSDESTEAFLKEPNVWTAELLEKIQTKKSSLILVINNALKESQL